MAEDLEKFETTVRPTKAASVVVVPREVVNDARLSLADLGLYVKAFLGYGGEVAVDGIVDRLLNDEKFGKRIDVDEAGLRAGIQRLIDVGLLDVATAKEKAAQAERDMGAY